MAPNRYLIIRFSAIGDVVQTLSIPSALKQNNLGCEVHFLTRSDVAPLMEGHPAIDKVISLDKKKPRLFEIARQLRKNKYTHIYDVHNSLRSRVICLLIGGPFFLWGRLQGASLLRRSIFRWKRFLLFNFRVNLFPQPFAGQRALFAPLKNWKVPTELPSTPQLFLRGEENQQIKKNLPENFVALSPSASYKLKMWPLEYWEKLITSQSSQNFVILGGPDDVEYLRPLEKLANVETFVGRLSLRESAAVIGQAQLLISNDTGLMHMAEQLGVKCIALMGPAPFGFPSRLDKTFIFEKHLPCRPCSKHGQGPCKNPNFHECLRGISPTQVEEKMKALLQ